MPPATTKPAALTEEERKKRHEEERKRGVCVPTCEANDYAAAFAAVPPSLRGAQLLAGNLYDLLAQAGARAVKDGRKLQVTTQSLLYDIASLPPANIGAGNRRTDRRAARRTQSGLTLETCSLTTAMAFIR